MTALPEDAFPAVSDKKMRAYLFAAAFGWSAPPAGTSFRAEMDNWIRDVPEFRAALGELLPDWVEAAIGPHITSRRRFLLSRGAGYSGCGGHHACILYFRRH